MVVAFQAAGTIAASLNSDVTPVIPSHQADDILIAGALIVDNAATVATPSTWTLLAGPTRTGPAVGRAYWFWKRATSGSETNPLMDQSSILPLYARVYVVRGAITSGNPFEAQSTIQAWTSDPFSATGVTSLTANALIVSLVIEQDNVVTGATVTATDPSSLNQDDYTASALANDSGWGFFSAIRTTAGATGNVGHDWNASPDGGGIIIVAIKPPAAATTGTVAATLQRALFSGTGAQTQAGTVAATLRAATFSATGAQAQTGTMAGTLRPISFAATGVMQPSGTLSATLQEPTFAATGTSVAPEITGAMAATLQEPTFAATGVMQPSGILAVTLRPTTFSAAGAQAQSGTLAATLLEPTFTATGAQSQTGTISAALQRALFSATGVMVPSGTVVAVLQEPTFSATGEQEGAEGALAATLKGPVFASSGLMTISGSMAATLQYVIFGGAGELPVIYLVGDARYAPITSTNARYGPLSDLLARYEVEAKARVG